MSNALSNHRETSLFAAVQIIHLHLTLFSHSPHTLPLIIIFRCFRPLPLPYILVTQMQLGLPSGFCCLLLFSPCTLNAFGFYLYSIFFYIHHRSLLFWHLWQILLLLNCLSLSSTRSCPSQPKFTLWGSTTIFKALQSSSRTMQLSSPCTSIHKLSSMVPLQKPQETLAED